jgi:hypothetical protein
MGCGVSPAKFASGANLRGIFMLTQEVRCSKQQGGSILPRATSRNRQAGTGENRAPRRRGEREPASRSGKKRRRGEEAKRRRGEEAKRRRDEEEEASRRKQRAGDEGRNRRSGESKWSYCGDCEKRRSVSSSHGGETPLSVALSAMLRGFDVGNLTARKEWREIRGKGDGSLRWAIHCPHAK